MREMLIFGLRICDALSKSEIDETIINQSAMIDGIKINPTWNSENISDLTKNMRLCILGTCFIVLDEALDDVFGEKPKSYTDSDIDSLRAIIFMLRCAIAHGPMTPRWQAKGIYNGVFRIKEIDYKIDTTRLDGEIVKHGDYGALPGTFKLIGYTLTILKRYRDRNQP